MKQTIKPSRNPEIYLITAGGAPSASRQPLDDLSERYLIGQWPREPYQSQRSYMRDKSTQTASFWRDDGGEVNIHKHSASWGSADHLIEISKLRQQLQFSLKESHSMKEREDVTSTQLNQSKHLTASSSNTACSQSLISRMSSYSDCINPELENVFICKNWRRKEEKVLEVRDGGRAPVPPPHHSDLHADSTETQISCSSPTLHTERDDRNGSPALQLSCSPKPNHSYMFKREPPEGCEKTRVFEDLATCRTQGFPISCPDRNKVNFSPSGSAFCPVKLLCSSVSPAERAACFSSLDNQTAGQRLSFRTLGTLQYQEVPAAQLANQS